MKTRYSLVSCLAFLVAISPGCIVQDSLTTVTINPDGSADLVRFHSNVRSTAEGEQAAKEIAEYRASLDARTQDDLQRIEKAGGRIESTVWVRREVPLANVVRATIPSASVLEKLGTLKSEQSNESMETLFRVDGARRRLTVKVVAKPPKAQSGAKDSPTPVQPTKQERANGISELRVAVARGKIIEARGFTIAEDRRSALPDMQSMESLLHEEGKAEFFLEWEIEPTPASR